METEEDLECTRESLRMYKQRIVRFEERLCISPYGKDRIDELEMSIEFKDFELSNIKDKLQKAIDAIDEHRKFYEPQQCEGSRHCKLWKVAEELR